MKHPGYTAAGRFDSSAGELGAGHSRLAPRSGRANTLRTPRSNKWERAESRSWRDRRNRATEHCRRGPDADEGGASRKPGCSQGLEDDPKQSVPKHDNQVLARELKRQMPG